MTGRTELHICQGNITVLHYRDRVVVSLVRELLFLVTSVIFAWIRGRGSKVTTTPYDFRSDFCQQLRFYRSGFVVLFPLYLSHKHNTFWCFCTAGHLRHRGRTVS